MDWTVLAATTEMTETDQMVLAATEVVSWDRTVLAATMEGVLTDWIVGRDDGD